ncbi:hypothetical protein HF521_006031 [Silurus meridionalis]|uniref:Small ribosomal subunit protein eS21 n=3 Tax=Silurus TaxID=94992 RepID=A0A8T0AS62_SILME|nr:hypothetical protein HF521_006031 [Silurus meridionalis]
MVQSENEIKFMKNLIVLFSSVTIRKSDSKSSVLTVTAPHRHQGALIPVCDLRKPCRLLQTLTMQNDAGEFVDLYVPRKCSASNRIIAAKDHASIQINIAELDKVTGRFNGQFKTYAICGAIRRMGEADDSLLRLAKNDTIVSKNI